MEEVRRRDDQELCGYVVQVDDQWLGLTVFHGVLGETPTRHPAETLVLTAGSTSLGTPSSGVLRAAGSPHDHGFLQRFDSRHELIWSRSADALADRIGGRST
jgi:hypothetical protein